MFQHNAHQVFYNSVAHQPFFPSHHIPERRTPQELRKNFRILRKRAHRPRVGEHPFKKVVLRVVALILLVMFLIPVYYTLRTLYLGPQVQVQEGG